MAEVWQSTAVETGRWFASSGNFQSNYTTINGSSAGGSHRYAARFNVGISRGATIFDAQVRYPVTAGSTSVPAEVYALDADSITELGALTLAGPFTASVGVSSGATRTADVTALVQQIVDRPGWEEGNSLAFLLRHVSNPEATYSRGVTLEVQWQVPVQYLAPVRVVVPVTVGAVESVDYSLNAAPVVVPVIVGAVDVVAPRLLTAGGVTVPVTVGRAGMSGTGSAPPLNVAARLNVPVTVGISLLSLTIAPPPPPIPWRRLITSPAYRAALDSRMPVTDARVEIINPDGAVIARLGGTDATHPGVLPGSSVDCAGTSTVRWTHELVLDNEDLIPTRVGDLFHPLSNNRMRVWHRIRLEDGTWGEIPCGETYVDWPRVADNGDGTVSVSVSGQDAMAELARNPWDTMLDLGGLPAHVAVEQIIKDRAPWATVNLTPTDYTLPADWQAGEPGGNPVEDLMKIAEAAEMTLFVDRVGVFQLAPIPDPLAAPVEAFIEGPLCAMTEVSAEVDKNDIANRFTVVATGTLGHEGDDEPEPVHAVAEDTDPTSPLYIGGENPHIYHKRYETDLKLTQEQADNMARRRLDESRALVDQVEIVAFSRAHLEPGDVVQVDAKRARITGARQVQSWSLGLGDLSGMRITTVGRRGLT